MRAFTSEISGRLAKLLFMTVIALGWRHLPRPKRRLPPPTCPAR